jgi:uncharacterized Zn-finger protein
MIQQAPSAKNVVEVSAQDLQDHGVIFCPNPKMSAWSTHPKIYINLSTTGEGRCPYCGTTYKLKASKQPLPPHHGLTSS